MRKLEKGTTLGVIAPSGPIKKYSILELEKSLKKYGFRVKFFESSYSSYKGYLGGTDDLRLNDIHESFLDKDIDVIMCIRGGYGSMRIIDNIDFDIIKYNKKPFIGFSDITSLLIAFNQKCDLITYHGIMAGSSPYWDDFSLNSLMSVINKQNIEIINPKGFKLKSLINGKASGKLTGGNLTLICSTLGTKYEIDTKNKILFIEDVGESIYRIDRMLTQLCLASKFDDCKGIIFGDFCDCKQVNKDDFLLEEILFDRVKRFDKPCIYNLRSGHCIPNITLPIGANCTIDATNLKISLCK